MSCGGIPPPRLFCKLAISINSTFPGTATLPLAGFLCAQEKCVSNTHSAFILSGKSDEDRWTILQ